MGVNPWSLFWQLLDQPLEDPDGSGDVEVDRSSGIPGMFDSHFILPSFPPFLTLVFLSFFLSFVVVVVVVGVVVVLVVSCMQLRGGGFRWHVKVLLQSCKKGHEYKESPKILVP
jgi:hypothetical protein